ncbi:MAG: hypothetical protein HYW01_09485 [Deltaproteobacteria bacterium]|nr:hypothetical protein [Deltaproteobacteria bacterium]
MLKKGDSIKKGSIIGQVVFISDEVNATDEKVDIIRVLEMPMKAEPDPHQIINMVFEE